MDREGAITAALQLQYDAGLMASSLQFVTPLTRMSSEIMVGLWSGGLSGCSGCYFAGAPRTLRSPLYGFDGFVASAGWPRCSRAFADLFLQ